MEYLPREWQLNEPKPQECLRVFVRGIMENAVKMHVRDRTYRSFVYGEPTSEFLYKMLGEETRACLEFYDELKAQDIASSRDIQDLRRSLEVKMRAANHVDNARSADPSARLFDDDARVSIEMAHEVLGVKRWRLSEWRANPKLKFPIAKKEHGVSGRKRFLGRDLNEWCQGQRDASDRGEYSVWPVLA